ncbi:hypothetical protein OEZ86_012182 [Tetradesmus obliquus]|nr:hypothetical protein OEZ86_012182 [Tetradesmus obliquus]
MSDETCTAHANVLTDGTVPVRGWNSWNTFRCHINETLIQQVADALVSSGLRDAGYVYVNIDDCWMERRDEHGVLQPFASKFPSGMKALADYVHSRGLKLGLYSDAGNKTCEGYPGSWGHAVQDAATFATWGVDYLKYDYCGMPQERQAVEAAYRSMSVALAHSGRPLLLSMCSWGAGQPWEWAQGVAASWRVSPDLFAAWDREQAAALYLPSFLISVMEVADIMADKAAAARPGSFNDADMIVVGLDGMTPYGVPASNKPLFLPFRLHPSLYNMEFWINGLLAMMLAAWCLPPGCHGATDENFNGVDVRVFKTPEGESLTSGGFIKDILQPYYGPSFHAVSPVLSIHNTPKATVLVILPNATQLSLNATNKRVARFGLTVTSEPQAGNYSQLEVGVEYDGIGWAPYFRTAILRGLGLRTFPVMYPGLDKSAEYTDTRNRSSRYLPAEAVRAKIIISGIVPLKPGKNWTHVDQVNALIETQQHNGSHYVHLGNINYTLGSGSAATNMNPELVVKPTYRLPFGPFFARDESGYALVRFGRFAALAPDNGKENAIADTADGSKLLPGRYLAQPMLFNTTKWLQWGASQVQHVWAVQTANLANNDLGTASGDKFGAESKVWYGGKCIAVKNMCDQELAFETAFTGWTNNTNFKLAEFNSKANYIARASAWQSDRGFTGLGSWVNLTSPGLTTNVVPAGETSVPFCITCSGSCREHKLQTIYLRVLGASGYERPPNTTDKTFCVNSNSTEKYSITNKDGVVVNDNGGAAAWDNYFDAVSNRGAATCGELSGDGLTFAEAAFVGFDYPTPMAVGGADQSHLVVQVSCGNGGRKLLTLQHTTARGGLAGNRRLLLV